MFRWGPCPPRIARIQEGERGGGREERSSAGGAGAALYRRGKLAASDPPPSPPSGSVSEVIPHTKFWAVPGVRGWSKVPSAVSRAR
eukprot:6899846-Pyramimonas_sp.AAC.1